MNNQEYFEKTKKIQIYWDEFLEDEGKYEKLKLMLTQEQIFKNRFMVKEFLCFLANIAKNHNRQNNLIHKTEQIIKNYEKEIKGNLTNSELFDIFKGHKLILLFLLKEEMITIDKSIIDIITSDKYKQKKYPEYFYPEIKSFYENKDEDREISPHFEEYRKEGENENYICKLIRKDSIEDFIIYINKTNFPLNYIIEPSIYETNSILLKRKPSLIEYAAFYGSIQIINYLKTKNVDISLFIWFWAIHSANPEIIDFLETNQKQPIAKGQTFYLECLKESIKCHHNNIANYILINFIKNEDNQLLNEENAFSYGFHYRNYYFLPKDSNHYCVFHYACEYNYLEIVKNYLKNKSFNINVPLISIKILNRIQNSILNMICIFFK